MPYRLSARSAKRLATVHPDLQAIINLAIQKTPLDFTVLEGIRSKERQAELYRTGASKTLNSRHLTGHAVDIAPYVDGAVSWHWPHYYQLEPVIKRAAEELGVPLEWGGDWKSFKDGPHWQLPWDEYGKTDMDARAQHPHPTPPDFAVPPAKPAPDPAEQGGLIAALVAFILSIFGKGRT